MSGGVKGGLGWGRISCSRLLQQCRRAITHQIGLILVAQEWQRCKICSALEFFNEANFGNAKILKVPVPNLKEGWFIWSLLRGAL